MFSILWPMLLRIILAMSILFHALQRRMKRKTAGTKKREKKMCRRLVGNSISNDSRSSSQFPMVEEKAKGHLVSPSSCRKTKTQGFRTSVKTLGKEKGGVSTFLFVQRSIETKRKGFVEFGKKDNVGY